MNFGNTKQEHPGWALQTKNGYWLSYAHGWHLTEDAFYARTYKSKEEAVSNLKDMQEDFQGGIECDIVVAWEPLCGQLRHQVKSLKEANTITPAVVFDMIVNLEQVIYKLNGGK